jgi:hypothetical protein
MPKRTVLTALVEVRLRDGEALLRSGEPQRRIGAIYVAGYGLECALKARLCQDRRAAKLPREFAHHDLRRLAECSTIWPVLKVDKQWHRAFTSLCSEWAVAMRYAVRPYNPTEVRKFIEKTREFTKWLSEH